MMRHYPDLGNVSDYMVVLHRNLLQPIRNTQIWAVTRPEAVRKFCTRFLNVISGRKQWWCRQMLAVFSG